MTTFLMLLAYNTAEAEALLRGPAAPWPPRL